jgi:hypothetical protein
MSLVPGEDDRTARVSQCRGEDYQAREAGAPAGSFVLLTKAPREYTLRKVEADLTGGAA